VSAVLARAGTAIPDLDVVVVGAGVAGLSAEGTLRARGLAFDDGARCLHSAETNRLVALAYESAPAAAALVVDGFLRHRKSV
jgi:NADPH-dependent 2,4-dienoyl-CoA reductase/sulfur reductase-like enzyme